MYVNSAKTFSNKKYSTEQFVEQLLNLPTNFKELINDSGKIYQELIPNKVNNWDYKKQYSKYQIVFYNDICYFSTIDNNINNVPTQQSIYWQSLTSLLKSNLFYEFTSNNVTSQKKIIINTPNAAIGIVDNNNMFWNLLPETVYYLQTGIQIDLSGILALKNEQTIIGTWKVVLNGVNNSGFAFAQEDPIYQSDKPNIVFKQNIKAQIINLSNYTIDGDYKVFTFEGLYDIEVLNENGELVMPNVYQRLINENKTVIKFLSDVQINSNFKLILKKILID